MLTHPSLEQTPAPPLSGALLEQLSQPSSPRPRAHPKPTPASLAQLHQLPSVLWPVRPGGGQTCLFCLGEHKALVVVGWEAQVANGLLGLPLAGQ